MMMSPIGERRNARTPAIAAKAPVMIGRNIPIAPTAKRRAPSHAATPQTISIIDCICGDRDPNHPEISPRAFASPSITGRRAPAIFSPSAVTRRSMAPLSFSRDPQKLSSRVADCAAASVFPIDVANLSYHSAPVSAIIAAARIASVPKIVVSAEFLCSSESPASDDLRFSAISRIGLIFP